jgi:acetyl esterase
MPLDPIVEALINAAAAMNGPAYNELEPDQARALYKLGRTSGEPEAVDRVEDLTLEGAEGPIPARLYAPSSNESLPVVLYYHGGGFVIGDIETHDSLCRALANRSRCAVVSVDYRLAPEHKFPAAVEDAYAALVDVHRRAPALTLDPARMAVAGDSAGGNLAAVVAQLARNRQGPTLAFQALLYPVIDFSFETASYRDNAEGYFLTTAMMRWFWAHYLSSEEEGTTPLASPLRAHSLAGLPPAIVITAEFDPLRDEGDAYARRLAAEGVAVQHSPYEGQIHSFIHMKEFIPRGNEALDEVAAALRTALAPAAG